MGITWGYGLALGRRTEEACWGGGPAGQEQTLVSVPSRGPSQPDEG